MHIIFWGYFSAVYSNGLRMMLMSLFPLKSDCNSALPANEILEISNEIYKKYAPIKVTTSTKLKAAIKLIPSDLLEISEEISRKYKPHTFSNLPNLVLLPLDPEHLYASWNLGTTRITPPSKDDSTESVLRVYTESGDSKSVVTTTWFDVAIDNSQTRQRVQLPINPDATTYKAVIGERKQDGQLMEWAASKVVQSPSNTGVSPQSMVKEMQLINSSHTIPASQERSTNTRINASGQTIANK